MCFCFLDVLVTNNEFQGVWGQLPWPSTATGLLCDRAATGYDPPIDEHRHKTRPGTLRLVARPRAASRRRSRPHARRHLRVAQVQLRLSAAQARSSTITPSSRQGAPTTGSLQPRLSSSRAAQAQCSLTGQLPWPSFGQHDGPASARSLRHFVFSAGQKVGSSFLLQKIM